MSSNGYCPTREVKNAEAVVAVEREMPAWYLRKSARRAWKFTTMAMLPGLFIEALFGDLCGSASSAIS